MTTLSVRTLAAAAVAMTLCRAAPAAADDVPGNSARIGLYSVFFHAKADDLSGPYVPAGLDFDADNVNTLYLGYVRRLSSHFDMELALGYPPLQKTVGKGPATVGSVPYDGQVVATARWLAPSLLVEYLFFDESSKLRPYIGAGANYTAFYDRKVTAQGGAALGGPTKLSLTSSVGPAGTAGLAYNVRGNWNLYASYSVSGVKTKVNADTAGVIRATHISFRPHVFIASVGYSF